MKKKDVRSMKLTMQLKSRSYDIILKAGCLANLHQFTNVQGRKVFVLTDSGVPADYAKIVAGQCQDATVYTIPQGEGSKMPESLRPGLAGHAGIWHGSKRFAGRRGRRRCG